MSRVLLSPESYPPLQHTVLSNMHINPGYPEFFSVANTECDTRHFSFFGVFEPSKAYLTIALRNDLNQLVRDLNTEILQAVTNVNAQTSFGEVRYVSTTEAFNRHRFCEPGAQEPGTQNPDNWFFLLRGRDTLSDGSLVDPAPVGDPVNLTPSLCDAVLALDSPNMGTEFGNYLMCALQKGISEGLQPADWITGTNGTLDDFVPESYSKTFHPKTAGHHAIVEAIEANVNANPAEDPKRVLLTYSGDAAGLTALINTLPNSAAKSRSKRYERDPINLRGYSTYLTLAQALQLFNSNPNVVGYSIEDNRLSPDSIAISGPPPAAVDAQGVDEDDPFFERRDGAEAELEIVGRNSSRAHIAARQTTNNDLDMFEDGGWPLPLLSEPPLLAPEAYNQYPQYVNEPDAGREVTIYILDTGVDVNHQVCLCLPPSSTF